MGVDRLKNEDFKKMKKLICIENFIEKDQNHFASFIIEPLEVGQGITLGNALRRTILSDITGYAISGVRINNLKHEFSIIEGLREDVIEMLLNLKEIHFKSLIKLKKIETPIPLKAFLNVKGPLIVTAGMFNLPQNLLNIINPNQYICTILDSSELFIEIDIEKGKGYKLVEENRKEKIEKTKNIDKQPSTIFIDSIFMPIKNVNYKIKLIHDSQGNIKESLNLEIRTNGTITPKRSLYEGIKCLLDLFSSLFIDQNLFPLFEKKLIMKKPKIF
jgi:DNA-directed RNA polymerase subunit alpha